jgi:hypothetical protein
MIDVTKLLQLLIEFPSSLSGLFFLLSIPSADSRSNTLTPSIIFQQPYDQYYTHQQKLRSAMEPNMKMFIEDLMKEVHNDIRSLRKEMKYSFVVQDVSMMSPSTHASLNSPLLHISTRSVSPVGVHDGGC